MVGGGGVVEDLIPKIVIFGIFKKIAKTSNILDQLRKKLFARDNIYWPLISRPVLNDSLQLILVTFVLI